MDAFVPPKKQPNKLLRGLILVSVAIHFVLFLHISGLYNKAALQFIELTMEDIGKPFNRAIPRPTHRPKEPDQPHDVKKIFVSPNRIAPVKPISVDPPTGKFAEGLMEGVSIPESDAGMGQTTGVFKMEDLLNVGAEYTNAKSYLEMVVMKIESAKRYPESARSLQQQGRVTVSFVVTLAGEVKEVQIATPCRHEVLNEAAVKAVQTAAPFPRPPLKFFKSDIPMKLNIIFETT
ncbi:MAG: energy transducer TonB [Desulfobacterium sp.]|nr:energy transducer TonB [Desulfobacterium sp.]MBU4054816.1 TonB family protein [Pseudomonadota bacterium]